MALFSITWILISCNNGSQFVDYDELIENQKPPHSFLLTWQNDPITTMTVDWHQTNTRDDLIQYREKGEIEWITKSGTVIPSPKLDSLTIQRVELSELKSDQLYEFRFTTGGEIFKFQTMPSNLDRPIRFVTGGDIKHRNEWMRCTNNTAAKTNPDFALIGGGSCLC